MRRCASTPTTSARVRGHRAGVGSVARTEPRRHRQGAAVRAHGRTRRRGVPGEMGALLDYARGELGARRVGVIGWCLGGRFALLLGARDADLANVVAYHPSIWDPAAANHDLDAIALAPTIAAPVMVLHAGADTSCRPGASRPCRPRCSPANPARRSCTPTRAPRTASSARARHDDPVNKAAWEISCRRRWPSRRRRWPSSRSRTGTPARSRTPSVPRIPVGVSGVSSGRRR